MLTHSCMRTYRKCSSGTLVIHTQHCDSKVVLIPTVSCFKQRVSSTPSAPVASIIEKVPLRVVFRKLWVEVCVKVRNLFSLTLRCKYFEQCCSTHSHIQHSCEIHDYIHIMRANAEPQRAVL